MRNLPLSQEDKRRIRDKMKDEGMLRRKKKGSPPFP
jgi:hypothetical protein